MHAHDGCLVFHVGAVCRIQKKQLDEQAADDAGITKAERAYMLNVGTYQNGVGYGAKWTNISGFSEAVIRFITELESTSR